MRFTEFNDQEVDEIIGVKKYHDMDAEQAIRAIARDMETTVIDSGYFGHVIQSSKPEVVYKVFEHDDGYLQFVQFVQRYPNEHFPKIYKVKNMTSFFKRYGVQEDKFYVIAMEKLYPVDNKPFHINFLHDLLNSPNINHPPQYMPDGRQNAHMVPISEFIQYIPELKNLWQAGIKVRGLHSSSDDLRWDLHPGNIMQRKDGTIVITDPLTSEKSFKHDKKVHAAKVSGEPMIKGPHYKSSNIDKKTGFLTDNVVKEMEYVTNTIKGMRAHINDLNSRRPLTPQEEEKLTQLQQAHSKMYQDYGAAIPVYRELKLLMRVQQPTSEQEARKRRLVTVIDQKLKIMK